MYWIWLPSDKIIYFIVEAKQMHSIFVCIYIWCNNRYPFPRLCVFSKGMHACGITALKWLRCDQFPSLGIVQHSACHQYNPRTLPPSHNFVTMTIRLAPVCQTIVHMSTKVDFLGPRNGKWRYETRKCFSQLYWQPILHIQLYIYCSYFTRHIWYMICIKLTATIAQGLITNILYHNTQFPTLRRNISFRLVFVFLKRI